MRVEQKLYPGAKLDWIASDIHEEKNKKETKKEKEKLGIEQDEKVRRYTKRKLEEYVEEGLSKEEAVDRIMQEKGIVKHFSYWTKNGIDIREMFISWINQSQQGKDREERER